MIFAIEGQETSQFVHVPEEHLNSFLELIAKQTRKIQIDPYKDRVLGKDTLREFRELFDSLVEKITKDEADRILDSERRKKFEHWHKPILEASLSKHEIFLLLKSISELALIAEKNEWPLVIQAD